MYQDGIESDKCVYIVTERVQPLFNYLRESKDNQSQRENEISWGLHQIAVSTANIICHALFYFIYKQIDSTQFS